MKKKILFINPNINLEKEFIDYPYFINLGMLQVMSVLKNNGYAIDVIDTFAQDDSDAIEENDYIRLGSRMNINKSVEEKKFDIAILINSPFLKLFTSKKNDEIQELMRTIKSKPNKPEIILADCYIGGMHYVNYNSKKIIEKYPLIDKVCKYECDNKLISLIEENDPKEKKYGKFWQRLDELPLPDYDAISMNNYINFLKKVSKKGCSYFLDSDKHTIGMFTSRGCTYKCIFCSSRLQNRTYRAYSLDYIKKHLLILKEEYDISKVIILDELANPNKGRLNNLLNLLNDLDLNYEFPNGLRADNITTEALSMMKNRMSLLSTSIESGCPKIINKIIKKNLDLNSISKLAESCAKIALPLAVHFMIGLEESYEDVNKTLDFAAELSENYGIIPLVQLATPIPGSELFSKLKPTVSQKQDLLDNYMKYFSKRNKFSKMPSQDLDIFIKNFNTRMKNKKIEKIIMNVTYACNNNCIFCAVGNWRNKKASLELQKQRLKEASLQGIRMVDFDGGEPTLDKNLIHLIKYSKSLGFEGINLITNGRLLSIKKNAKIIIKSGITSILFSLHGPNKNVHEQVTRAEGSFEQTVEGIKNVLEINGQSKSPVGIGINITLTGRNILCLNDFLKMVEKMGVKKLNIQAITPFGLAKKEDLPKKGDMQKILPAVLMEYSKNIDIKIVNLPFCQLKGYESYLIWDISKNKRNMVFIGKDEQNLAEFLASKRHKDEECARCLYGIICNGKWDFDG